MSSTVLLQASGLQTSPNELERPPGALIEAKNVIIRRDNIIEQRRGFRVYGDTLPSPSDRVKQLTSYRNRIIRHFSNKLQYDSDGQGRFLDFIGSFLETESGLRMKFIEANGNFYFTTSEGIKKISARTANDFGRSDVVSNAGAIKAVDFLGKSLYTPNSQSAFLPQDGTVAYRIVWGYKDINNNLVLGAPSQRVVVGNPMTQLLLRDYTRLLSTLDSLTNSPLTEARINDKNYILQLGLNLNSSAFELFTNIQALSEKIDRDIKYARSSAGYPMQISSATISSGVLVITVTGAPVGDYLEAGSEVFLEGVWTRTTAGDLNGAQTVVGITPTQIRIDAAGFPDGAVTLTSAEIVSNEFRSITIPVEPATPVTNDDLLSIQEYLDDILFTLLELPDAVLSASDRTNVDLLDITTTSTVELDITVPIGIDSRYFLQVYRSSVAQALGPSSFVDVFPGDEMQLVYEAYPTPAELSALRMLVVDQTPDDFRGANLYTNAATGEGILQANDIPPFAKDINRYRNSTFYANTRTQQRMFLNLLGVNALIADYDNSIFPKVTITNGEKTNTYNFVVGKQEITDITTIANVANSLNGKYFLLSSLLADYYVYFDSNSAVDPAVPDRTGIRVVINSNETKEAVASKLTAALKAKIEEFIVEVTNEFVTVVCLNTGITKDAEDVDTGFTVTVTQQGNTERVQPEITEIVTVSGASLTAAGPADFFTLNEPFDQKQYIIFFTNGLVTPPVVPGAEFIAIEFDGTETDIQIAEKIEDIIPEAFIVSRAGNTLTITNKQYGKTTLNTESVADVGFTLTRIQEGALDVLLSPVISPAQAVDQTARSFIRVLNKNPGEIVYGFYLSTSDGVPGRMLLEGRSLLEENPFYVLGNNDNTGISFNPDIGPDDTIVSIGAGSSALITTTGPHGLQTGDQVVITNTSSTPQIDGLYEVIVLSSTTFTIPKTVDTGSTGGAYIRAVNSVFSENERRINRVYYSKFLQPDAVPIANFFDVGAADMEILRIFPLRDSLFVFKEDGVFRISGESAPFQLDLFDNSFILNAPDSVAVSNNVIYAWTTQGIQSLTENGAEIISRPIDNLILRTQSNNFSNFPKATWGIGYESDNSYLVFTVEKEDDTVAQIAYRYSTLTRSWTTYDKSSLAGVVNMFDDRMYLAASDIPNIEQERKTFSRLDFADREFDSIIGIDRLRKNTVILPSVSNFSVGDVLTQTQTITTYNFNQLLDKLDFDPGLNDNDYLSSLKLVLGESPRLKLTNLSIKLDSDPGTTVTTYESSIETKSGTIANASEATNTIITSPAHGLFTGRVIVIDSSNSTPSIDGTHVVTVIDANTFSIPANVLTAGTAGNWQTVDGDFRDLKACYNKLIELINSDIGISFNNYKPLINDTLQEVTITAINTITRQVTFDKELDFLVGPIKIFKSIKSSFTYSPTTMGDPLMYKHLREATLMFETRAITRGALSFATDLLPEFQKVDFTLEGNGIFGHTNGFGDGFFGGIASSAPFRTYIPRQCMRCRYIVVKFEHNIAREDYKITGMTLTGEIGKSTRAYR